MSFATLDAIAYHACTFYSGGALDVVFHSGEPLVVGIPWFDHALHSFRIAAEAFDVEVTFGVQTNGTLITPRWAQFFADNQFMVGISIDGPQEIHDASRHGRSAQPSFRRAVRGLKLLQQHGLHPTVLAVLTTPSLSQADDIFDFFRQLGVERVGFNVEDATADHGSSLAVRSSPARLRSGFTNFLIELSKRLHDEPAFSVRELTQMARFMYEASSHAVEDLTLPDVQQPMRILSYDIDGNFGTYCPELMSAPEAVKQDFVLGNVNDTSVMDALASDKLRSLDLKIARGREHCKQDCDYFAVCRGGKPSSKVFEVSDLEATETLSCVLRVKAVADAVMSSLK